MDSYRLREFEVLPSTNAYARENLETLPDGTVIRAHIQTAGRGRLNRTWFSAVPGNIYASLVLQPIPPSRGTLPLANLTQYLSLVLCRLLEQAGVTATIKWPNDVQVDRKKIAGILAELHHSNDGHPRVILGFGINLNFESSQLEGLDQPATSLNLVLGHRVDDRVFLQQLLEAFFTGYQPFLQYGFASLRIEYLKRCPFLGQELAVSQPTGRVRGIAATINLEGALELWTDDGTCQVILTGDTSPTPC